MAKISLRLLPDKASPDGACPIIVYATHKGQRARHFTPVRIRERDWNSAKSAVRKSHPDHHQLNAYLAETLALAERALTDMIVGRERIRLDRIIDAVRGDVGPSGDFLDYIQKRADLLDARGQYGTRNERRNLHMRLQQYRRRIPWDDIDVPLLEGFETFLLTTCGNAQTTVHKQMKTLRAVLYNAIREGVYPQEKNPFFRYRLTAGRSTRKKVIPIEDVWKIEDATFTGLTNDVRNAFVFAFYSLGMRISDVLMLTPEPIVRHGGAWRIEYDMMKTKAYAESVPLLPGPERILREYGWPDSEGFIFPFMPNAKPGSEDEFRARKNKTSLVNKYLKQIQAELGIETRLTTHVARHSLANILDESGMEIQAIQRILRHTDSKTTEAYLQTIRRGRYDDRIRSALSRP